MKSTACWKALAWANALFLSVVHAGQSIAVGEPVIKYGSPIGIATSDIQPGAHVHTHNVASTRGRGDLASAPGGHTAGARVAAEPDDIGVRGRGDDRG